MRAVAPGDAPLAAVERVLAEVAGAPVDLVLAPQESARRLANALGAHRRVLVVLDPAAELVAKDAWAQVAALARSLPALLDAVPALGVLLAVDHRSFVRLAALPGWAARLYRGVIPV